MLQGKPRKDVILTKRYVKDFEIKTLIHPKTIFADEATAIIE